MSQSNEALPPSKRSIWSRIFISPGEPRLRAGWRLLIQSVLFLILSFCAGTLILTPILLSGGKSPNDMLLMLFNEVVEIIAVVLSVFLARRFLDKRSFVSLGLKLDRRVPLDLLAGIAITFVMMGGIYLTMNLLGWIDFQGFAWQREGLAAVIGNALLMLFIFVLTGWNEELLSRGYHLQTIASGTNLFWGVLLSSAIFGTLHLFNPNATWISALGILFAGLFLAFGYLCTGQLWLSIGLHIGWNFFEGSVFGFPVSGLSIYSLTHIQVAGPTLWTGGAFGPEAGLIVLPAIIIGTALIYVYSKFRPNPPANQ